MGLDEDARQVMIAKNEEHGRYLQSVVWDWHRPLALTRFFEWLWYRVFGHILIGYGYEPWRAFVISIGVILLGWRLFRRGYFLGLITPKGRKSLWSQKMDRTYCQVLVRNLMRLYTPWRLLCHS
jgi:hypothetical protein